MYGRLAVLGAGKGFGSAVVKALASEPSTKNLVLAATSYDPLKEALDAMSDTLRSKTKVIKSDFTNVIDQKELFEELEKFVPDSIMYIMGGTTVGDFHALDWKEHFWSLELNMMFPSKLLHFGLSALKGRGLKQFVFLGPHIAEKKPDPGLASYSAAKHGMIGLLGSITAEKSGLDIRVFSSGLTDSSLIPKNAPARQPELKIHKPEDMAQEFVAWLKKSESTFHRVVD